MKSFFFAFLSLVLTLNCNPIQSYDLIIYNASLFNVHTGQVHDGQTLLINDGIIVGIVQDKAFNQGEQEIDAKGQLVTPGMIDTHIHPTDVWGDYDEAPEFLARHDLANYRRSLSEQYLPYGVTTALMMGHPDKWLSDILSWGLKDPHYTDFLTSGGALISPELRLPYIGHLRLDTPEMAKEVVKRYHDQGVRHLKVYYRLNEPEFSVVMKTAAELNMRVYGHIGDADTTRLSINQTLDKGLLNYEHLVSLPYSVIQTAEEWAAFDALFLEHFGEADTVQKVLMKFLEAFRYMDEHKQEEAYALMDQLAAKHATFSTTIGYIHQQLDPTSPENTLTKKQLKRSKENFGIMMCYLDQVARKGIKLRIATDTKHGGKVLLDELYLLSTYGFSSAEALQIATINGAKALHIDANVGSIDIHKQANLVIWKKNPLENPENFLAGVRVIKNGKEVGKDR